MDKNLLTHKILDEAKTLRKKVGVWITQIALGIHVILRRATVGIKAFYRIVKKEKTYQIYKNDKLIVSFKCFGEFDINFFYFK